MSSGMLGGGDDLESGVLDERRQLLLEMDEFYDAHMHSFTISLSARTTVHKRLGIGMVFGGIFDLPRNGWVSNDLFKKSFSSLAVVWPFGGPHDFIAATVLSRHFSQRSDGEDACTSVVCYVEGSFGGGLLSNVVQSVCRMAAGSVHDVGLKSGMLEATGGGLFERRA
jgi:hypothetical protein